MRRSGHEMDEHTGPWLVWGFAIVMILAREVYRWRREVKLSRALELLSWRERFARTRRDVVALMTHHELEPDSVLCGFMYVLTSAMVRRASDYRGFAENVVREALRGANKTEEAARLLEREIRALSPDAREVFLRFMEDTHLLLTRYSRLYWLIVMASRVVAGIKTGHHRLPWRRL